MACQVALVMLRESWSAPRIMASTNRSFCIRKLRYPLIQLIATIRMVSEKISLGPS